MADERVLKVAQSYLDEVRATVKSLLELGEVDNAFIFARHLQEKYIPDGMRELGLADGAVREFLSGARDSDQFTAAEVMLANIKFVEGLFHDAVYRAIVRSDHNPMILKEVIPKFAAHRNADIQCYYDALEMHRDSTILLNIGIALLDVKQQDKAYAAFQEIIRRMPESENAVRATRLAMEVAASTPAVKRGDVTPIVGPKFGRYFLEFARAFPRYGRDSTVFQWQLDFRTETGRLDSALDLVAWLYSNGVDAVPSDTNLVVLETLYPALVAGGRGKDAASVLTRVIAHADGPELGRVADIAGDVLLATLGDPAKRSSWIETATSLLTLAAAKPPLADRLVAWTEEQIPAESEVFGSVVFEIADHVLASLPSRATANLRDRLRARRITLLGAILARGTSRDWSAAIEGLAAELSADEVDGRLVAPALVAFERERDVARLAPPAKSLLRMTRGETRAKVVASLRSMVLGVLHVTPLTQRTAWEPALEFRLGADLADDQGYSAAADWIEEQAPHESDDDAVIDATEALSDLVPEGSPAAERVRSVRQRRLEAMLAAAKARGVKIKLLRELHELFPNHVPYLDQLRPLEMERRKRILVGVGVGLGALAVGVSILLLH